MSVTIASLPNYLTNNNVKSPQSQLPDGRHCREYSPKTSSEFISSSPPRTSPFMYFRRFRIQRKSSSVDPPVARAPSRSSQRSRANSGQGSRQVDDLPMRERPRSTSAPQKRQPMTATEDAPPVPSHTSRTRAKSASASSSRNTSTPVGAGERYLR